MSLRLQDASYTDIPLIRELALRIWPATYSSILSKEQIDYMLDWLYNEKMLTEQMQQGFEFVLICDDEQPIGFAATSMMSPTLSRLHKLYVDQSQHGKGTGRFTIEEIIRRVKAKGATSLELNVNRHNKAKGFYEKLGFTVVREEDIDIGSGYFMNDYVMSIAISH